VARRSSIATRWALGYAGVILASIAAIGFIVDRRAERIVLRDGETLLEFEAKRVAEWIQSGERDLQGVLSTSAAAADPDLKFGAAIFDAQGVRLAARGSAEQVDVPVPAALLAGETERAFGEIRAEGRYAWWVSTERADGLGYAQVTMYSRSFVRRAHRIRYAFLAGLPLAAATAAVVGIALARASLRPVAGIVESAHAVRGGALETRLPLRGTGDEFDQIAAAFNAALDRLQTSMEALLRFSQDAAHQLRSPLTALRGRIDVALGSEPADTDPRRLLGELSEDAARLSETVDAILALSRTAAGLHASQRREVELRSLLAAVVEFFDPLASEKGIALALREDAHAGEARLHGDVSWLRQCFVNLIDNALRHTPSGGKVEVDLRREGGDAVVEVRDTGRGIPPAELERVFERFHRLEQPGDEPGMGLGLALAREIAQVHGGSIEVSSVPGLGSTFRVSLPLAAG
jgi:signal transduction histidine kinase